ncbi:MAG TPA: phosphoglucosamine mutase [Thermoanaerobaculia bacterium]|nr:phosphoglucosamine mutase [Thermoanaerobaculia bacterium]
MRQLFGTDGIRGKARQYPLDEATLIRLGYALARRFPGKILLGRDTRESGPMIAGALAAGLREGGAQPVAVGVIPTPGIAYLCRTTGDAVAAISISASHNPWEDNGVKIFGHDGMKLPDRIELEIEQDLERVDIGALASSDNDEESPELIEEYERFLIHGIPPAGLKGRKVVLDVGHGAACRIAPEVFRRVGAEVVVIHDAPNGRNINENAGALHPERLAQVVVEQHADYGVAFDGDADRAIFADDAGKIRDGDEIIYLWAKHLKLPLVVTTVMSNFGFEKQLQADGIELLRAQVGDKYVLEQMLQRDALLGGEQSGHIIDRTVHTTGDGIHTAVVFGHILGEMGQPFSKLHTFDPMPQLLLNEKVASKPALDTLPKYQEAHAAALRELDGRGRILVRYSGTENLVRVMVEGEDDTLIRRIAEDLRSVLKEEIDDVSS